ncbi:Conserved hypothetical protein (pyridoxamine 5'-phosphate oxidase-related?) [Mycobacteroides abscessus]|nr:Conserved hypothetical protein (pyridoxamine 5'-phosphate oxidase-related?) [Mycobacteroides abscessus]
MHPVDGGAGLAQRYRTPRVNPKRVVIEVKIERVLGSSDLLNRADSPSE